MANKSAKDLAFEKERAKYRKEIRESEQKFEKCAMELYRCKEDLIAAERKINELQDWVERLLIYTELSEEDMKKLLEKEKISAEMITRLSTLFSIFPEYKR